MRRFERKSDLARKITVVLCIILLSLGNWGCSIQKLAVGATGGIIDKTLESLYEESDLELAEISIASNLKLLEGLIKSDPGNEKLLQRAIEGYTGYALAFAEDKNPERARFFYDRAAQYGRTLLAKKKILKNGRETGLSDLEKSLASAGIKDVPALFWTANAWASYINLSRTDPDALFNMPKVMAIMRRVLELDEEFYYGGAHLFFGTIYASLGVAGGDLKKSKEHFDRALEIADQRFLLTLTYLARYYAVSQLDEELFRDTLRKVLNTPGEVLPEYRLINEVAKKKARLYLSQIDEWF